MTNSPGTAGARLARELANVSDADIAAAVHAATLANAAAALAAATNARNTAISSAHAAGMPVTDIAAAVGLTRQAVYNVVNRTA